MTRRTASKVLVIAMALPIGIRAWQKLRGMDPPPVPRRAAPTPAIAEPQVTDPRVSNQELPDREPSQVAVSDGKVSDREVSDQQVTPPKPVPPAPAIDHGAFDALLKAHADPSGVDYAALKRKQAQLQEYLESLADLDPARYNREQLLALYINAYNAATLKLIVEHYPGISSIKDIPARKRWDHRRWRIARETLSLNDMEHEVLRARLREPRIHFAIVCASVGCPPLRAEAYTADQLQEQLDDQARLFHRTPRHFRWDPATNTLYLSSIYKWFGKDFQSDGRSVKDFAARYAAPQVARQLQQRGDAVRVKYLDYDWSLNTKS